MAESTDSDQEGMIETDGALYVQALEAQIAAQAVELARLNFLVATMSVATLEAAAEKAQPTVAAEAAPDHS